MLQIQNFQVHDDAFLTCTLVTDDPNPAYQVRLDGWNRARPIEEFSWYPPNLVVGSADKPLAAGERTLSIQNGAEVAIKPFVVGGEEPEPEPGWETLIELGRISDWKNTLIAAPGASITEGQFQGKHAIRVQKPNPGERCELHHMDDRLTEGAILRYRWNFWLPSSVQLPGPDTSHAQQHGDNQGGYGGGVKFKGQDRLIVSIKGGEQLSTAGSHRYEYELNGKGEGAVEGPDEFGTFERGRWNSISYIARWSTEWDGFVRISLNDGPELVHEDVPTFSKVSDSQMFRLGWYEGSGDHEPLDIYFADAAIDVTA